MPDSDLESRIAQTLSEYGGPPELAPQLVALAVQYNLTMCLEKWIAWHIDKEWSAAQFNEWCVKYWRTFNQLEVKEGNL